MRSGALRLTGGEASGRKLFSPAGDFVRPALARVRGSLFNILRDRVEGARVLDVFAGTGVVGLEALSRGAAACDFLETHALCLEAIRRNVDLLGYGKRSKIVRGDAFRAVGPGGQAAGPFDLVFIDPPYAVYDDGAVRARFLVWLHGPVASVLEPAGLAVLEHRSRDELPELAVPWRLSDRRKYGQTSLSFMVLDRMNLPRREEE